MPARTEFRAPWSRELFVMSAIGVVAIGAPTVINLSRGHLVIGVILLTILMIPPSLTVRGYEVLPRELLIRRLFWASRWPLSPNTVAAVRPKVMETSWRLWGNGGGFSFSGVFSNAALGRYHAFVTDSVRTSSKRRADGWWCRRTNPLSLSRPSPRPPIPKGKPW